MGVIGYFVKLSKYIRKLGFELKREPRFGLDEGTKAATLGDLTDFVVNAVHIPVNNILVGGA